MFHMSLKNILAVIDAEIARLKHVSAILADTSPKSASSAAPKKRAQRRMSAEGRKRIAEAQRRRWAAQRKATANAS